MWNETYTSSQMSATQWGYHPADEADEARERIVDAAEAAIQRWGVARTRIDDIAADALHELATSTWTFFRRTDPTLKAALRPGVAPPLAAEWMLRIMLSYLAFPGRSRDSRQAMRRQLRLLLLPALFKDE